MTIEDLRERGALLPREEWGAHHLETAVPEWRLAFAFALALLSLAAVLLGDGGSASWAGAGGFLLSFLWITWICGRAVGRQRRRFLEEREALRRSPRGLGAGGTSTPAKRPAEGRGEAGKAGPPGSGRSGEG